MNAKKTNVLFLTIILYHIVAVILLSIFTIFMNISIVGSLLFSQSILIIPTYIVWYLLKEKGSLKQEISIKKIKPSTIILTIFYTWALMPLITLINAISMLFVENTVINMSGEIFQMPFALSFFMIGIFGPIIEEVVFRGFIFKGYRRSGNAMGAILLSALLFGLMHMNINQAMYAFVIGIALAFLVEVTGSIFPAIIMHMVINCQSVISMYLTEFFNPGVLEETSVITQGIEAFYIQSAIVSYFIISLFTTTIAWIILKKIGRNEGFVIQRDRLLEANYQEKRVTMPLVIAVIICIFYMVFTI
ncbi:MAG: lysostaphin resistance A-like protein [Lachnospiraceae bacterium]